MASDRIHILLVGALGFCCQCDSSEPTAPPASLSIVVGVQAACSDQTRDVALRRHSGDENVELLYRDINSPADLPVSTSVVLVGSTHTIEAKYTLESAQGIELARQSMQVPGESSGRVALVLPCICRGVVCDEGKTCAELPPGSGKASCIEIQLCGDGACDPGESSLSCPADCRPVCGDGVCSLDESCGACPKDCGACAGAGQAGQGGAGMSGASGQAGAGQAGKAGGGGISGSAGQGGAGQAGGGGAGMSGGSGQGGAGAGGAGAAGDAGSAGEAGAAGLAGEAGAAGDAGAAGAAGEAGAAGAGGAGAGGAACVPKACAAYGRDVCGLVSDGCKGQLDCGGCPTGQTCGASEANICGGGAVQCDPIKGTGCPAHRPKCSVFQGFLTCTGAGTALDDEPCQPPTYFDDGCAAGLFCNEILKTCSRVCTSNSDCLPDYTCDGIVDPKPPEAGAIKSCVYSKPCDILAPDCPPEHGCYDDLDLGISCAPSGTAATGQPCSYSNECAPGNTCLSLNSQPTRCYRVCDTKAPVCPSGQCKSLGLPYGVCD